MNITRATAAAGAVLLVVATAGACGSSQPAPRVTVTTTQTVTAAPGSPPTQDDGGALKMGTEQTLQDDQGVTFTVQAMAYQQPFKDRSRRSRTPAWAATPGPQSRPRFATAAGDRSSWTSLSGH